MISAKRYCCTNFWQISK